MRLIISAFTGNECIFADKYHELYQDLTVVVKVDRNIVYFNCKLKPIIFKANTAMNI